jgi:two-component system NarL family response regulator
VEDDELFRLGLVTRPSQEPGLDVAGEAKDGETAIAYPSGAWNIGLTTAR